MPWLLTAFLFTVEKPTVLFLRKSNRSIGTNFKKINKMFFKRTEGRRIGKTINFFRLRNNKINLLKNKLPHFLGTRGMLSEDTLKRAAMHFKAARRFRDIVLTFGKYTLYMLPFYPIRGHRIFRGRRGIVGLIL